MCDYRTYTVDELLAMTDEQIACLETNEHPMRCKVWDRRTWPEQTIMVEVFNAYGKSQGVADIRCIAWRKRLMREVQDEGVQG